MSLTIDTHHHVIPDFYWEASNEDGNAAGGITPPRWSRDGAIAYLDEAEIDVAVASISTPGVHFGDDAAGRTLACQVNEFLADVKDRRPDRFGGFAAIPLPDVEGSLEQIEYALDSLKLDGVSLMTNADGSYLGDSRFDAVFEELQRRAAVVFVHPTASPDPVASPSGCRTPCWTTRPTPHEPSPSCTTATPWPALPTSSTSSPTPAERFRSWPRASEFSIG